MKKFYLLAFAMVFTAGSLAQGPPPSAGKRMRVSTPGPTPAADVIFQRHPGPMMHGPMGKWWKDSELAKNIGLSEAQIKQIEQTFYDHRLKLIDMRADLEREEAKLQPLIESDQPDEAKVGTQIDAVSAARGRLEKANAMMMLSIRKILSLEQWKKLQEYKQERHINRFERRMAPGAPAEGPGIRVPGPGAGNMQREFHFSIPAEPAMGADFAYPFDLAMPPIEMAFVEPFAFSFPAEPFDIMLSPEFGTFEFYEFEPFEMEFPAVIPLLEDRL
jgi:periplasmic protein CpxP/Spy